MIVTGVMRWLQPAPFMSLLCWWCCCCHCCETSQRRAPPRSAMWDVLSHAVLSHAARKPHPVLSHASPESHEQRRVLALLRLLLQWPLHSIHCSAAGSLDTQSVYACPAHAAPRINLASPCTALLAGAKSCPSPGALIVRRLASRGPCVRLTHREHTPAVSTVSKPHRGQLITCCAWIPQMLRCAPAVHHSLLTRALNAHTPLCVDHAVCLCVDRAVCLCADPRDAPSCGRDAMENRAWRGCRFVA